MKTYRKIDIYFNGDYICSTNQSKTCKEAVSKYLERAENNKHSLGGIGLLDSYILRRPELLKAYFDKDKR